MIFPGIKLRGLALATGMFSFLSGFYKINCRKISVFNKEEYFSSVLSFTPELFSTMCKFQVNELMSLTYFSFINF